MVMHTPHPKAVRRRILGFLYDRYLRDPLDMVPPEDFLETGSFERQELIVNAYYLYDRGLIELMNSYHPPMFAAARITADGIDLVENTFEFNRRFPGELTPAEEGLKTVPVLVEQLLQEAEYAPLDGEARRCLLRDVEYLRDELARPAERWRRCVLTAVLEWVRGHSKHPDEELPSSVQLLDVVRRDGEASTR